MELKEVKRELKELRKRNSRVNDLVSIEEMYRSRLQILSDRNEADSKEYKAIAKNIDQMKTLEQLKGEIALETKYFDILNNLPYTKKNIALKFFLESKSTIKICHEMFMDQQVLYNEISQIYQAVYKKINEVEEE